MDAYTRELLRLRHDARWTKAVSGLPDSLAARTLSIVAWCRYLCPTLDAGYVARWNCVTLVWEWQGKLLAIIVPDQLNPFDEDDPADEICAFYMDRTTGELWRETGFSRVGSGCMHPIFPPQVEQKLLEAHSSGVQNQTRRRSKPMSAFRFRRLFPDLEIPTDKDDYTTLFPREEREESRWRIHIKPIIEGITVSAMRYLMEEWLPKTFKSMRTRRNP
ncbi:MAG: hypothetical protein KatS3mg023_3601 [Armatimonadota bacterium]|nr:MAG: hypothetical protein KatS3mg023_3601 [Armatimonadota bacterium]